MFDRKGKCEQFSLRTTLTFSRNRNNCKKLKTKLMFDRDNENMKFSLKNNYNVQ